MKLIINEMKPGDWKQAAQIYLNGIETKIATFENKVPSWEEWDRGHCNPCRLAARLGNAVLGWAALTPVSGRYVYRGVAEESIYIDPQYQGLGIGVALLTEIIKRSEENGFWTLEAAIIEENTASRELHRKCGFREVGIKEKLGQMDNGRWHDVVIMERRSRRVGVAAGR